MPAPSTVGILLAAGRGGRFGADKRWARMPGDAGEPVALVACRNLIAAVPRTIAVVRFGDDELAALFERAGAQVVACARADEGMGVSLACGVAAAADASGWIIALGDMPWIAATTIGQVAKVLHDGAEIVAPSHGGRRGHPVGFAAHWRDTLVAITGDRGARAILDANRTRLTVVDVADAGILRDVDHPGDLAAP